MPSDSKPESVIAVAVALVLRDGRVLITRRPPDAHLGGCWEFPGGKLQSGESPEDGALRELLEETGMRAEAIETWPPILHA